METIKCPKCNNDIPKETETCTSCNYLIKENFTGDENKLSQTIKPDSQINESSIETANKINKFYLIIFFIFILILAFIKPVSSWVADALFRYDVISSIEKSNSLITDVKVKQLSSDILYNTDIEYDYNVTCFVATIPDVEELTYDELNTHFKSIKDLVANIFNEHGYKSYELTYGIYIQSNDRWYGASSYASGLESRNLNTNDYNSSFSERDFLVNKLCARLSKSNKLTQTVEDEISSISDIDTLFHLIDITDDDRLIIEIHQNFEEKQQEIEQHNTNNDNNLSFSSVPETDDDYWYAVTAAQNIVKDELIAPSKAKFPTQNYTVERSNDNWIVGGYVDAQNSFGATIRETWIATFTMGDTSGTNYKISNYSVMFLNN